MRMYHKIIRKYLQFFVNLMASKKLSIKISYKDINTSKFLYILREYVTNFTILFRI